MRGAKVGIFPQLAISFVKGQFALKNSVGEYSHRHDVVNVRELAVID